MYIHTRELGVTYDLFQPPSDQDYLGSNWITGAIYYAELVVAEALGNHSIVTDLNLDNSLTSPSSSVAVYAIYDGEQHYKSKLVLLNYDYPRNSSGDNDNTTQAFVLPANLTSSVGVRYLLASNITEQTAIMWAGQTVGGNGELQGEQALDVIECTNGCTISVPGPGLAVAWLDVSTSEIQLGKIFQGNSTIAGVYNGTLVTPSSGRRVVGDASVVMMGVLYCSLLSLALVVPW